MTRHKILLFGGNGQIGKSLQALPLPADWELQAPPRQECDLCQPAQIAKSIQDFTPNLVINSASMTDVDACEKDIEQATEINFNAVAHIAAQCATIDAPLLHLSTDYVFDGDNDGAPYLPDTPMNPLNIYGQTKMMGEEAVRHTAPWHVILRVSSVFSAYDTNILTRALRQIDARDHLKAAGNQMACPTGAASVAVALRTIAQQILRGKGDGFGTFHFCGQPASSRFDLMTKIIELYAPYAKRRPQLDAVLFQPMAGYAPRPLYSVMNCDKIRTIYGLEQPDWQRDLAEAIQNVIRARVRTGPI